MLLQLRYRYLFLIIIVYGGKLLLSLKIITTIIKPRRSIDLVEGKEEDGRNDVQNKEKDNRSIF